MKKGRCYTCNDIYSDRAMTRHIKTCLGKVKGAKVSGNNSSDGTYLIKVQDKYDSGYYLYLLTDGCVLLSEIDQYLRDIWLECCGHLSSFVIDGISYERYPDEEWGDDEDMEIEIHKVLHPGMTFSHLYDYGSTTELELNVSEKYEPLFDKKGIYLVGRNMPREFKCDYCNNKADFQFIDEYSGEQGIVCNSCMKGLEGEKEELYFSDIINSPRTGVCGYAGPADDIMLMEHKDVKGRKSKKNAGRNEDKLISKKYNTASKKDKLIFQDDNLEFMEKLLTGELTPEDIEENPDFINMLYNFANITKLAKYRKGSMPPFMVDGHKLDRHMLKDYLRLLRKNELDEIRKNLDIENASGLKKDKLIERINGFLLDNIEDILTSIPSPSYISIMQIYKIGQAHWEARDGVPEILDDLRGKGLLFSVYENEDMYKWVIPDDMKNILNKLAVNNEFQKRRNFSDKVSKAILAVFYYWGIVTREDLMIETARLLDLGMDDRFTGMFDGIFKNMRIYLKNARGGLKLYYYMYVEDVNAKLMSPEWKNAEYPLITKDMIPEGDEGWLSLILHNPYLKWIYDTMVQEENEEFNADEDACELVSAIAHTSLNARPGTDANKLAEELEVQDELFKVPFMKELLDSILLHTPNYWMKGNSISSEIHVNNEEYKGWQPSIGFAHNPVKNQKKNTAETAALRWKVGRNDPCPCGSGKKFKNCCGK